MASSSRIEAPLQETEIGAAASVSRARVWLILLALTAVAAVIRLYKLGEWSFWVDEMFTLRDTIGTGWRFHGMTYPLSYILIGMSMGALGVSEWSARLVPALFGIATPAMVYLLGRRSFGELPSIFAAAIIAISPWHLYWSQMARFYSLTVFFSTASILVLYRGLEENRKSHVAAAGILMALATISHYSALLVLGAVAVYVALIRVMNWSRPRGLNLTNSLIFLAPFILGAVVAGAKAGKLLAMYAGGHPTGTTFSNPLTGGAYMVVSLAYRIEPAIALLALVGIWLGLKRRDRGTMFLACTIVVPVLFLIVCGVLSHAENRYAFVVLPAAAILAGSALSSISRSLWSGSRVLAIAVPLVVALPLLQHDVSYFGSFSNGERWNYRAAADYLRSHARPGDVVYSPMPFSLRHYLSGTRLVVQDLNVGKDANGLRGSRAWIVMEDATRGESASRELSSWLKSKCQLKANFPASSPVANYGLSVYLFHRSNDNGRG